jgi:hypothetical protein
VTARQLRRTAALLVLVLASACSSGTSPTTASNSPAASKHSAPHGPATSLSASASLRAATTAGGHLSVSVVGHLPQGLSRAVAVVAGDRIVVLSGLTPGDVSTSRVLSIDPATATASLVGHLGEAVHDASGAYLSGNALVFGGGAATSVSDVQAFHGGSAGVVGHLPAGRSDSAAATLGGTAYVAGGFDGHAMSRAVLSTRDGRAFATVARLAVGVRYAAVTATPGALWIIGGQLATTESTRSGGQTSDLQRVDLSTGRVSIAGRLPATLGHAAAFTLRGAIYVVGGRSGDTASARIWRVDPATAKVAVAGRLPMAYSDMAAVVIDGAAWLVGGEAGGPNAPLRTIVRLTVS